MKLDDVDEKGTPLAACSRVWIDPEMFFDAARELDAKLVCSKCPLRFACLEEALDNGYEGIWGATNLRERNQIKKIKSKNKKVSK